MRTLLPDPLPADFAQLLELRRRQGLDTHDEVWAGVLHVNPAAHGRHGDVQAQLVALLYPAARVADLRLLAEVNLGEPDDFRVPDACIQDPGPPRLYYPTAALAVEVVSPSDETWAKLEFYAARGVLELLIVDPQARSVQLLALAGGVYAPSERSGLIELERSSFAELIDWPSLEDGVEA